MPDNSRSSESTTPPPASGAGAVAAPSRVVALLLLVVTIFQTGSGILAAVVPIRLADSGLPPSVVGWVTAAFSAGFLIGCLAAAPFLKSLSASRAMVALALATALASTLLSVTTEAVVWAIARGITGFTMAVLLVLVEAWLATAATTATRARIFGVYMVLGRLSFTIGQTALALVDPASAGLLIAAAAAYLLSPWPAFAIPGAPPEVGRKSGPDLRDLPFAAPAAAMASVMHGLIGTSGPALLPLFALARGYTVEQVALLLAAIPIGGLVFQLPFSRLSDRLGRRTTMAWLAGATLILSLAFLLPTLPPFPWLLVLTAMWGGAPAALYVLAVAHANDIATDAQRVGWSSTLLLLWGIGAAAGPLVASLLMERAGYDALFWFTGALGAFLLGFLVLRKLMRKRGQRRAPASETIGPAPGPSG